MEARLIAVAVLLVALILRIDVLARSHSQGKHSNPLQVIRDDGMTFESFMEEGSDDVTTFGVDILQEFHLRTLECQMNISKLELRYQVRMQKLIRYYHDMEKAVKVPSFQRLSNHNRQEMERNIHGTMNNLEREHVGKMREAHKICGRKAHVWLEGQLARAVNHAKKLVLTNPSLFEEFLEKIRLFQSKLYSHKRMCEGGRGVENTTITCDLNDLQLLLNFTNTLIGRVNYVRDSIIFSDDEDLISSNRNIIGSGNVEYDEPGFDDLESSASLRVGDSAVVQETVDYEVPPLPDEQEEADPHFMSRVPPAPHSMSQVPSAPQLERGPQRDSPMILNLTTDMGKTTPTGKNSDSTTSKPSNFKTEVNSHTTSHLSRSKGESTATASATTGFHATDNQQVNEEGFQDTTAEDKLSGDFRDEHNGGLNLPEPSPQSPEESQEESKPGQDSAGAGDVVIIDDPKPLVDDRTDHTHSDTNHRVLVILAALVGVVLLAVLSTVAVLAFFAVKKRRQQKSGYVRVLLTSETEATNETLEGIKRDGYVNPTYKFYTRC